MENMDLHEGLVNEVVETEVNEFTTNDGCEAYEYEEGSTLGKIVKIGAGVAALGVGAGLVIKKFGSKFKGKKVHIQSPIQFVDAEPTVEEPKQVKQKKTSKKKKSEETKEA